ncbi:MAG: ribonuclease activity regulator RraA [Acidobacteria bacterium]|nr:ribonuclease activity regulator RraA [Acidobacteriota bacterium]
MSGVPAPPEPDVLDSLRRTSTATVSTQLLKRGLRTHYIEGVLPLNEAAAPFAAPAFTLRYIPAREDKAVPEVWADRTYPQRKAIETVPEGWALVIDSMGDTRAGSVGDILALRLAKRGVAALVTDGALRDTPVLAEMDFPVFCAGAAAPASVVALFAADLQCPIGCGGAAVFPGDIVVGDAEGIVIVPRHLAEEVARDGAEQERLERFVHARIEAGHSTFGTYPPDEATLAAYALWKEET